MVRCHEIAEQFGGMKLDANVWQFWSDLPIMTPSAPFDPSESVFWARFKRLNAS